jgi:DNA mismatch repair protein MSH6
LEKFLEHREKFDKAVKWIAQFDCLQSLATVAHRSAGKQNRTPRRKLKRNLCFSVGKKKGSMCFPVILDGQGNKLSLQESYHPLLLPRLGGNLIPNTVELGSEHPPIILLSGPNMGGKSTLLRQVIFFFPFFFSRSQCVACLLSLSLLQIGVRGGAVGSNRLLCSRQFVRTQSC